MNTIETVKLADLVLGSKTRPPLTPLTAAYIAGYRPRYAILTNHWKYGRMEIVITSDSLGEVMAWMDKHPDQRAYRIT